jgi:hypothetical protein
MPLQRPPLHRGSHRYWLTILVAGASRALLRIANLLFRE